MTSGDRGRVHRSFQLDLLCLSVHLHIVEPMDVELRLAFVGATMSSDGLTRGRAARIRRLLRKAGRKRRKIQSVYESRKRIALRLTGERRCRRSAVDRCQLATIVLSLCRRRSRVRASLGVLCRNLAVLLCSEEGKPTLRIPLLGSKHADGNSENAIDGGHGNSAPKAFTRSTVLRSDAVVPVGSRAVGGAANCAMEPIFACCGFAAVCAQNALLQF